MEIFKYRDFSSHRKVYIGKETNKKNGDKMKLTQKKFKKFCKKINSMTISITKNRNSYYLKMTKTFKNEIKAETFNKKIFEIGKLNNQKNGYTQISVKGSRAKEVLESGVLEELDRHESWKDSISRFLMAMEVGDKYAKAEIYKELKLYENNGREKKKKFSLEIIDDIKIEDNIDTENKEIREW